LALRPVRPAFAAEVVYRPDFQQRQNSQDKQQMRSMESIFLDDIGSAKPCLDIQQCKGIVDPGFKAILTLGQIALDFTFKTSGN